jgi:hypothetical protein
MHESYCRAQATMYDKPTDKMIEFACSNGLNSLKVCHEYLDLKLLASGKPKEKETPTPLAPGMQDSGRGGLASSSRASVTSGLRSGISSVGMLSTSTSVAPSQMSQRAPPRQPAPAITDEREVERAFAYAAAARMSFTRPLSMSIENRGGGAWGGLMEAGAPPAGPAAGGSLFDTEGHSLFEIERNPAKFLESSELVIDGTACLQHCVFAAWTVQVFDWFACNEQEEWFLGPQLGDLPPSRKTVRRCDPRAHRWHPIFTPPVYCLHARSPVPA